MNGRRTSFLLILLTIGCAEPAATPVPAPIEAKPAKPQAAETAPPAPALRPREEVFPTAGVGLIPPTGWSAEAETPLTGFLARWLPTGAGEDDWSQFTVEVSATRGQTTKRLAEPFVAKGYESTSITIDGLPAVRLVLSGPHTQNKQAQAPRVSPVYLAVRGSNLYRMLFILERDDQLTLADEVAANWRWRPETPAAESLELGLPQPVLGGALKLRLPKAARRAPDEGDPATSAMYIVYDFLGHQDALVIGLELRTIAAERTNTDEAFTYAAEVEEHTKLSDLLVIKPLPANDQVWASAPLVGKFEVPGPTGAPHEVERVSQFALWRVAPTKLLRLQFVVNREVVTSDELLAKTAAAINEMLQSLGR
jgi:hypothetical protein